MAIVEGLEKHPMLCKYVEKAKQRLVPGDEEEAAIALRKSCETMVDEFVKQRPSCNDPALFNKITNLEEKNVLSREEADLFHALRKIGNEGGAHAGDTASLKELESVYQRMVRYLPEFLKKFPSPGEAIPRLLTGKKLSPLLDLQINYDRITPLEINVPNPDYTFLIADAEKESEKYIENDSVYVEYERCKWIKDIDKYTYYSNGKLYLDRKKMMHDYERIIKEEWANEDTWAAYDFIWKSNQQYRYTDIYLPFILEEYVGFNAITWDKVDGYAFGYLIDSNRDSILTLNGEISYAEYWTGFLYNPDFEGYSKNINEFTQQIKEIYKPVTERWEERRINGDKPGIYSHPKIPEWALKFARNFGFAHPFPFGGGDAGIFLNMIEENMGVPITPREIFVRELDPSEMPKPRPQPQPRPQAPVQPKPQTVNNRAQQRPAQTQNTPRPQAKKGKSKSKMRIGMFLMVYGALSFILTFLLLALNVSSLLSDIGLDVIVSGAILFLVGRYLYVKNSENTKKKR